MLVTNGGKQAVYNAFATLSTPATRCICPAPYWTTYPESITLAGGVPVVVPTDESTGFRVTVEQLEAARTERTKVLLFVSPSNPTGRGVPARRGRGHRPLGRRARHLGRHRRDLRAPRLRTATSSPRCRCWCPSWPTRCVVVNGVAKTYAMTGWRVGLDDRARRTSIGRGDQPPVARHLERGQRAQRAALAAVSGDLEAVADDARGVRPPRADRCTRC